MPAALSPSAFPNIVVAVMLVVLFPSAFTKLVVPFSQSLALFTCPSLHVLSALDALRELFLFL